ncbi:3-deoxy-D-manno-octulosonic acid kinase [Xanthomonadaceae bacterium JHOS43]|nr:3-deoxy-D-manno-octulosonic acid kinase [Xanthomonadaceae bacterium JHOS43]MCX7563362.1 3-deoxy-D-manno-octulosonic acid kinase [Xanthomonadaceae bacterium XH05]
MQNAHIPTLDVQRAAFAQGAILFDRHSLPQATPRMLDPTFWAGSNALEGRGGRGSAWLVHGRFGDAVLRHYRRGGLVGRWVDDRYLFLGEASVRCVREFQLLARLYERGLPVPRPLLAGWQRSGLSYRADLMTLRVPDSRTLAECRDVAAADIPWHRIGATLARFHREGAFHADLNAHNVLLDARDVVWLIDFDRGDLRVPARDWQQGNLRRLRRSLDKLGGVRDEDWSALLDGYTRAMAGTSPDELP